MSTDPTRPTIAVRPVEPTARTHPDLDRRPRGRLSRYAGVDKADAWTETRTEGTATHAIAHSLVVDWRNAKSELDLRTLVRLANLNPEGQPPAATTLSSIRKLRALGVIEEIASGWRASIEGLAQVGQCLAPTDLREVAPRLTPTGRLVLGELLDHGGAVPAPALRSRLGRHTLATHALRRIARDGLVSIWTVDGILVFAITNRGRKALAIRELGPDYFAT
jgi:hypothetical protein